MNYENTFLPVEIGGVTFKNRIFSGPHNTALARNGRVSDELIAYHMARVRGGVSLIITEVQVFHPSYHPVGRLSVATDEAIPYLSRLVQAVNPYDCHIIGQLWHPGQIGGSGGGGMGDGELPVQYAPSESPNHFYHSISTPMSNSMIWDIIDSYGKAAGRMVAAGLAGVEIVASMGYLPAQFMNARFNRRTDEFGGNLQNRLRFIREVVSSVKREVGPAAITGIRISGDEMDEATGYLTGEEVIEICRELDGDDGPDYFHVTLGSGTSILGWRHQIPHMALPAGYITPYAARVKKNVNVPVLLTGRMNDPAIIENVIANGHADMCGLVRALIADPEFVIKTEQGRTDDIRACIACNQACIGHRLKGYPVSCIQHPESGRELAFYNKGLAPARRKVMVVGGGPGGMKAAIVAAQRGHDVRLYEKTDKLGGQVLLAQLLPGRSEFGGLIENLENELFRTDCEVVRNTMITRSIVMEQEPDTVIVATGGIPYWPDIEGDYAGTVVDAWSVLKEEVTAGQRVLVADSKCDWISLGIAHKLALEGRDVSLYTNGAVPGELIPHMIRDYEIAALFKLGVEMVPFAQLYGVDGNTVYFHHTASGEHIIVENVDTVVLTFGNSADRSLSDELSEIRDNVEVIGDAINPRTAEEAVVEGMRSAHGIGLENRSIGSIRAGAAASV